MEVHGLKPFMTYAFRAAAQTFAGPGVFSKPFYAETCRCEKNFYAAYRNHMPYFGIDSSGNEIGLLKDLVKQATHLCCGNCSNGHGTTEVVWRNPLNTVSELNDAIMNDTEFVLPIETDYRSTYHKNRPFVNILETPGVAIFSRQVEYLNITNDMMLFAASVLWTFVIIAVLFVVAIGMVMWLVVRKQINVNCSFYNRIATCLEPANEDRLRLFYIIYSHLLSVPFYSEHTVYCYF